MASRESALRRRAAPPLHASAGSARLERTKKREMHGSLKEAGRQNLTDSPAFGCASVSQRCTALAFREKLLSWPFQGEGAQPFL